MPVTEIWAIPEGGPLPPDTEALKYDKISTRLLTEEETLNERAPDYRALLQKFIANLRDHPNNTGVVIGYFLGRPSRALRRRMSETSTALRRSKLSQERYFVRLRPWTEGDVDSLDLLTRYPSFFVVENQQ